MADRKMLRYGAPRPSKKGSGRTGAGLLVAVLAAALIAAGAAVALAGAAVALGAEGELDFIECLEDAGSPAACSDGDGAISSLDAPYGIASSPDGEHIYAAAFLDDAVSAFRRNAGGGLEFLDAELDVDAGVDGLNGPRDIAVSPDGSHVYAVSRFDDAIAVFSRNPASGTLSFVECLGDVESTSGCDTEGGSVDGIDGADGVTVSADGRHVYVAGALDDAVAVFARNPSTGALDFVEAEFSGIGGVSGLQGASAVLSSADGTHLYVASDDSESSAVAAFRRNATSGSLSFVEAELASAVDGIDGASALAEAPDGRHLYVSGTDDNAIAVFERNATNGRLSLSSCVGDADGGSGCDTQGGAIQRLNGARAVVVSADGKHLYAAAIVDDAVTAFSRDPDSGSLSLLEQLSNGSGGVNGLDGARTLALSPPDGENLYVGSSNDDALAAFSREADTSPPETVIDSGPSGAVPDPTPRVRFSSSDPDFTAGFQCRLDGGAFGPCSSPLTLGPLSIGVHTFAVRARDTAGNVDPTPAQRAFEVTTAASPLPVEGQRSRVIAKRGRIFVNTPGPGGYRRLAGEETLPIGTKVDAREGRVQIVTEFNGRLQRMLFWAGRFKIQQREGRRPFAVMKLIGKKRCGRKGKSGAASALAEQAGKKKGKRKRRKKGRRLWGKGKRGKYRSKGRRGSATVRGTKWRTEDRCNGSTRFTLKRGKIVIDDFGKRGKRDAVLEGKGRYTAKR